MTKFRLIARSVRSFARPAAVAAAVSLTLVAGHLGGAGASPRGESGAAPKVMTCAGRTVSRPSSYMIACADGNTYLRRIHWTIWASGGARATATFTENTCTPTCVAGKFVSYRAKASLSRARLTTSGRLFTQLSVSYTSGTASHHFHTTLPTTPLP